MLDNQTNWRAEDGQSSISLGHAPLWRCPAVVFNLLDMIRIDGAKLYDLARTLSQLESALAVFPAAKPSASDELSSDARTVQTKRFKSYRRVLKRCGLDFAVKSTDRTLSGLKKTGFDSGDLRRALRELHIHIKDELEEVSLWRVEYPDFLAKDGLGLKDKFKEAHRDAEEAGKCLAFGRNTAGVFHLMRVMEVGLRELGGSLNDASLDPKTNPTWEKILGRCDKELAKPYKERSPEWAADGSFFSSATADLRAVKDAWRNPTLHVERFYDGEEARDVWNAARAFMRHLALKLG